MGLLSVWPSTWIFLLGKGANTSPTCFMISNPKGVSCASPDSNNTWPSIVKTKRSWCWVTTKLCPNFPSSALVIRSISLLTVCTSRLTLASLDSCASRAARTCSSSFFSRSTCRRRASNCWSSSSNWPFCARNSEKSLIWAASDERTLWKACAKSSKSTTPSSMPAEKLAGVAPDRFPRPDTWEYKACSSFFKAAKFFSLICSWTSIVASRSLLASWSCETSCTEFWLVIFNSSMARSWACWLTHPRNMVHMSMTNMVFTVCICLLLHAGCILDWASLSSPQPGQVSLMNFYSASICLPQFWFQCHCLSWPKEELIIPNLKAPKIEKAWLLVIFLPSRFVRAFPWGNRGEELEFPLNITNLILKGFIIPHIWLKIIPT